MKILLDSHTLLWALDNPDRLSETARALLQDGGNALFISAATVWEMAIKVGTGKLVLSVPFPTWMQKAAASMDLQLLPVTVSYASRLTTLPLFHRDPFDRLLIAQALEDDLIVLGTDEVFDTYHVRRVW